MRLLTVAGQQDSPSGISVLFSGRWRERHHWLSLAISLFRSTAGLLDFMSSHISWPRMAAPETQAAVLGSVLPQTAASCAEVPQPDRQVLPGSSICSGRGTELDGR